MLWPYHLGTSTFVTLCILGRPAAALSIRNSQPEKRVLLDSLGGNIGVAVNPIASGTSASITTPVASTATSAATTAIDTSTMTLSGDDGYIAIVQRWRSTCGLPTLDYDRNLEANALKTSHESVGGLIHQLNTGTMAQVLASGTEDNFESVYVGGWLCEIPSLPGLDGICASMAQGWNHGGQTGHAEILTDTKYARIGCAYASSTSVWACDFA